MRSAIIATLSVLVTLATVSVASAQNDQSVAKPGRETPAASNNPSGITVEKENAVPYHPCTEAYGWVNGRLRCDNRY
jgi:hypothetical protein